MNYLGGKTRFADALLKVILKNRYEGQVYVEPFVGGANVIWRVGGPRMGRDINPYLIALYKALQNGYLPPESISEEEYSAIKKQPGQYAPELVAFVAIACSFGGKWFGGMARNAANRNYCAGSFRALMRQLPGLLGIEFSSGSYDEMEIPPRSLIYCDPPYRGTTRYRGKLFDSDKFFQWCDQRVSEGHSVFISEYAAPSHWNCVWEKAVSVSLHGQTGKKAVERLFSRSVTT